MIYTYYAIRRKSDGFFLRNRKNSQTFSSPARDGGRQGIRFFKTKRGASLALTAWLKGCWYPEIYIEGENNSSFNIERQYDRRREDMEVVECRVEIIDNA